MPIFGRVLSEATEFHCVRAPCTFRHVSRSVGCPAGSPEGWGWVLAASAWAAAEPCTEIIPRDYFNPPADVGLVAPAPAHAEGRSSARRARCSGQTGYSSRPDPLSELFGFLAAQCRDRLIYFLKQVFVTILED